MSMSGQILHIHIPCTYLAFIKECNMWGVDYNDVKNFIHWYIPLQQEPPEKRFTPADFMGRCEYLLDHFSCQLLRDSCNDMITYITAIMDSDVYYAAIAAIAQCHTILQHPSIQRVVQREKNILLFVFAYKEVGVPRDIARLIGSVAWRSRYE